MKKLLPIIFLVALALQACGGSGSANPTPIGLPTAKAKATAEKPEPTAKPSNKNYDPGEERNADIDGMPQVFIPAGTFWMGGVGTDANPDENPAHNVTLDGFWIDKVEVTNGMYKLCVDEHVCQPPRAFQSATHDDYFKNVKFNDYPVVNVGWSDAKTYCEWAGRRLPTEAEWEYTARGDDYRVYPWGDQNPNDKRANFKRLVGDTASVGSYQAGATAFGVLDMAGNVWEWTNDFYDPGYYAVTEAKNPHGPDKAKNGFRRVIRGGSWKDVAADLRVSRRGFAEGPNPDAKEGSDAYLGESGNNIGFRCVADN